MKYCLLTSSVLLIPFKYVPSNDISRHATASSAKTATTTATAGIGPGGGGEGALTASQPTALNTRHRQHKQASKQRAAQLQGAGKNSWNSFCGYFIPPELQPSDRNFRTAERKKKTDHHLQERALGNESSHRLHAMQPFSERARAKKKCGCAARIARPPAPYITRKGL